jgi:hypothetical protein
MKYKMHVTIIKHKRQLIVKLTPINPHVAEEIRYPWHPTNTPLHHILLPNHDFLAMP